MKKKRRIAYLVFLIFLVVIVICGSILVLLYNTTFKSTRQRLVEIVHNQARFIEAVAKFDSIESRDYPGGWKSATLSQITYAHKTFEGFGETGEFTLAKLERDTMFFLLNHRFQSTEIPLPIPYNSKLAEPMRLCLSGKSGSVIGLDYRGVEVLAAYIPVAILNYGIVAKIDISEVRAPFLRASALAMIATLFLGIIISYLFIKTTTPLIKELEENELRMRNTFDQIAVGIVHFNLNGEIVIANKGFLKLTGYTVQEITNVSLTTLLSGNNIDLPQRLTMNSEQKNDASFETNTVLKKKNGETLWVNMVFTLVKDYKTLPKYFIAVCVDINDKIIIEKQLHKYTENLEEMVRERTKELESMQEKMIKQEKLAVLGQLAGSVGHELRNPLGVMTNAIYFLLTMHENTDEKTKEYLNILDNQIKLSNKIITDLLDFSRTQTPARNKFEINKTVQEILDSSDSKEVQFYQELDHSDRKIFADYDHVRMILQNIITNAVQATKGTGVVEIKGESLEDKYQLTIKDNGCGMNEKTINLIFDPLFTTKERGIGLGLSICKNLAELNGIALNVTSELNEGTTFSLLFPLEVENEKIS